MLETATFEGYRLLTLSRPAVGNALDAALVGALTAAIAEAGADPALHSLVLRAEGPNFCTGFDLSDLASLTDGDLLLRFVHIEEMLAALWHCPLRTLAFAPGRAWGAGADLFACCDVRAAEPQASFCFPGVRFGLVLGTRRLRSRIGEPAALEWLRQGARKSAEEAARLGLVTQLVTHDFATWLETLAPPVTERITAAALKSVLRGPAHDGDLAALVRSAARPGLKQRLEAYRLSSKGGSPQPDPS